MSTYAIGDIQGCFDELQTLLAHIHFHPEEDTLWLVGDLVNRGPKSLEVLRFIKNLPNAITVLGNHDLHLLAVYNGYSGNTETLDEILNAPDAKTLIDWLRLQPILHHDPKLGYAMTHAGIYPHWDLETAKGYAKELEDVLRAESYTEILPHLYGNHPNMWSPDLTQMERLRFIMNAFMRMRFCDREGKLDFDYRGPAGSQPDEYIPWYEVSDRKTKNINIIFGHWAALNGKVSVPHLYALDTGCVWGNYLTALRLEDGARFRVRPNKTHLP